MNKQIGVGDIRLGPPEKKYLQMVIDSNRLSYGQFSQRFEKEMAQNHDCNFGIFCNSGTSALLLALMTLKEKYGWSDGDEVIVPALTFIATSNVVLQANMVPIFVDADEKTYNINPDLIEQKITNKTRCIIPVHMFGLPCEMDKICVIANANGLRIIEDSCETMFASFHGKKVGSFGDLACFSTYIAHFLVTGVGGLVITNDSDLAVTVRSMMNHGRDSIYMSIDDDRDERGVVLKEVISKRFSFVRMGYSFRATELEAAIGLGQLEQKEKIVSTRIENAHFFKDALRDLEKYLILPFEPEGRDHHFMMFPIVVRSDKKNKLINFLEEANIETRDMPTVIEQPFYKQLFGDALHGYPVTKKVIDSGFYIGSHQYLTKAEKGYIIDKLHEFYK